MSNPAQKEALQAYYRFVAGAPQSMEFALPRAAYLILALVALLTGAGILLFPLPFDSQPGIMRLIAGWGGVLVGLVLGFAFLRRSGRLRLIRDTRTVELDYSTPADRFRWRRDFADFAGIECSQVKDMHGLHNHWRIELVARDGTRLKLGYGFMGAVRESSRDRLLQQLGELTGLPVARS